MRARNAGGELSEAAFQRQVEQLAGFYGWRGYHTHDSRRSAAGFPDLVLVRGPELLFSELKTNHGRPTAEQRAWLEALGVVGDAVRRYVAETGGAQAVGYLEDVGEPAVEAHLWRPREFDELHARLARGRHRQPVDWAR